MIIWMRSRSNHVTLIGACQIGYVIHFFKFWNQSITFERIKLVTSFVG